ncbi:MAG: HEAT repeat domain-containing protein [Planctomycetes bacterium]|nr:HEAT repeat domain-containing protein [Planctomycetota bacterium]
MIRNPLRHLTFLAILWYSAAALGPAVATCRAQSEEVADFKRVYAKKENVKERIEAIFTLDGVKGREAAEALLPCFKDENGDIRNAAAQTLVKNDAPEAVALLMETLKKDKVLRPWACLVLGLGARKEARAEVEKLAQAKDADFSAKYRAAEALGRMGDPASIPVLLPLASDSVADVRIAVADALGRIKDETASAGPALITLLGDKEWRVRAAAIHSLAVVRTKDALEPLVNIVAGDEGRLIDDAAKTLKTLTGLDYGGDGPQWKRWLNAYGKDPKYHLPTIQELAKLAAARQQKAGGTGVYPDRKITEFLGVKTPSKRVMFIIDVSGSMEDLILEKERYKDQNYPGYRKIDIVKEELARTLERLDSKTEFSIVTFATKVRPWKKGQLQQANVVTKTTAMDYVRGLEPIGGHSKEELAAAGLGGAANLAEGKTNTHAALLFGLGNPARGVLTKSDSNNTPPVDTIFFLSDGKPSTGELVDTDDILAAIREANQKLKITIHVLAIGEFEKNFMKKLAEENGGVFVDLGK